MKTAFFVTLTVVLCACSTQPTMESMSSSMSRQHGLKTYTSADLDDPDFKLKAAFIYTVLHNTTEVWTHRMNGEVGNEVFVHNSGGEIVFDENQERVDSCANKGSFNYAHYKREPLAHFTVDSLPWMQWGNCRQENTTVQQRIDAYLKDFEAGLRQVVGGGMQLYLPNDFDLTSPGDSEALAFYFSAFDASDYNLKAFILESLPGDNPVADLLNHLQQGFAELLI